MFKFASVFCLYWMKNFSLGIQICHVQSYQTTGQKDANVSFHQDLKNPCYMIYYLIVWKFQTKTVWLIDKGSALQCVCVSVDSINNLLNTTHLVFLCLLAGVNHTGNMQYLFQPVCLIVSVATIMIIWLMGWPNEGMWGPYKFTPMGIFIPDSRPGCPQFPCWNFYQEMEGVLLIGRVLLMSYTEMPTIMLLA